VLDEVPGIGTKRKQQLMKAFGSLKSLREAAPEEIVRRASIPDSVARTLSEWLKAEA
jgi:excinuclease ABC subunit C